jgi:hypothetical protein
MIVGQTEDSKKPDQRVAAQRERQSQKEPERHEDLLAALASRGFAARFKNLKLPIFLRDSSQVFGTKA